MKSYSFFNSKTYRPLGDFTPQQVTCYNNSWQGSFELVWTPNRQWIQEVYRAPDKVAYSMSKISNSSPNSMFDHLLESSHRDDSNKWSNTGFGKEIGILDIKIRTLSGALHTFS